MAVPDIQVLSSILVDEKASSVERRTAMAAMFGGQKHVYDYHKVGLYWEYLQELLVDTGFCDVRNVSGFGLFDDSSDLILAVSVWEDGEMRDLCDVDENIYITVKLR